MNTESFPSLPEQGKNLAKFTFDVVKSAVNVSKPVFAAEEKQKDRLAVCKTCPYYSSRQNRCMQCGCFLTHKVQFEVSQCPVGKW